ncbi:MAG: flagellar basal body-associated FliL family protein [Sarcina sp.]
MPKDKEEKKSNGITTKKMIIIGVGFLIITFICTFAGMTFLMKKNNPNIADKKVEKKKEKVTQIEHLPLGEDFVVNLSEVGIKRYVKANVTVAYDVENKEFIKNIDKNVVILRDSTITYLKGRTEEQLKDLEGLKIELVKELNEELKAGNVITDAYFQSFLIQ